MNEFKELIGTIGYAIEAVGVLVMIVGFFSSSISFLKCIRSTSISISYRDHLLIDMQEKLFYISLCKKQVSIHSM